MEKTLHDAVNKLPAYKTEVFKGVLEQLRWFAGKQVKSVAVSPCSGVPKAQDMRPLSQGGGGVGAGLVSDEDPAGLELWCLELPGVLVKMLILGPHSQRF